MLPVCINNYHYHYNSDLVNNESITIVRYDSNNSIAVVRGINGYEQVSNYTGKKIKVQYNGNHVYSFIALQDGEYAIVRGGGITKINCSTNDTICTETLGAYNMISVMPTF